MVNWTDDKGSSFLATFLVFDFSFLAPSHISRFIGSSVTLSDFNYVGVSGVQSALLCKDAQCPSFTLLSFFSFSGPSWSVRGPWDVIYFLKSMTKSCHIVVVGVVLASLMPRLGGEFSLILAFVGDDMDYHIMMQHIFFGRGRSLLYCA